MRLSGGFLSLADLATDQAEWWEPIRIAYRGYDVVTASPPANAFDMLVRLGMMSRFDLAAIGQNSVGLPASIRGGHQARILGSTAIRG